MGFADCTVLAARRISGSSNRGATIWRRFSRPMDEGVLDPRAFR
jgi:hypothetical protein